MSSFPKFTKRRRTLASPARNDEGASLIMVLVFIMVFSVVAGAILDFASTGFRTTNTVTDIRKKLHSADGAMDGAINAIRSSTMGLSSAGPCLQPPNQFRLQATTTDPAVDVTCSPSGSSGGIFDNQPAWAILTLGKSAGQGINKTGNFHTEIVGGAFSSKDIESTGGPNCKDAVDQSCNALTVDGDVIALGNCDPNDGAPAYNPTRLYTPTGADLTCLRGASDADREARGKLPLRDENNPTGERGYPTALGWPTDLDAMNGDQVVSAFNNSVDPPAVCQVSNTLAKFAPGMYTQPLQNLIPTACRNATTWWLSPSDTSCSPSLPGVYYFDFNKTGSTLWDLSVTNASVIGGKLAKVSGVERCSDGSGKSVASAIPAIPGACVEDTSGVQLIFGGKTAMKVKNSTYQLDVCTSAPDPALTKQRLVMYGLPTGTANPAANSQVKNATSVTATNFTNPNNAMLKDAASSCATSTCARAALHGKLTASDTAVKSASLTLNGFPDIPSGSTITAATLEVTHQESGPKPFSIDASWQSVDALNNPVAPPATPVCSTTAGTITSSTSLHTDVCNLMTVFGTATYGPYAYRTYNGIDSVTFNISSNTLADFTGPSGCNPQGKNCSNPGGPGESATVDLDAVVLKVSYIPPAFEATNPADSGADSPCAGTELFCSKNNPTTEILGTVYAPTAALQINVHNRNFTNFNRGVVVLSLGIDASASDKQPSQSPISLPASGPSGAREVTFTATIDGKVRLRARVLYVDKDPSGDDFPGYAVKVLNWEVVRS